MAAPPSARRERLKANFPKLVAMTEEFAYADIWERPGLSKRDRSMITVAALIALGREEQLATHLGRALGNGVTREEIGEIVTHLAIYAGWPAAMTAAHIASDVYEGEGKKA
ncbi:carboxymuconolactone decarboxylase family protein [Siccirubricoccus phaeus]|uniref:carboxymuconolactone decarboxylase family protein n=1 Tax=Siccirubricoccus phaeus TaxID=2595053 RepID=UPI0011F1904A|nr:carboxymuconolactone decarboxylase family protein [Siccirubricoccus phaeus]